MRLYGAWIYSLCRSKGVAGDAAADLMQQVLIRVHHSIGSLRRDRPGQGLRRWLNRITRNAVIDHFRELQKIRRELGNKVLSAILEELPSDSPDDSESNYDRVLPQRIFAVRQALESIRDCFEVKTWQAFWRTTVEGHATKDVAADMDMSPGSVRQAKSSVLKHLKLQLNGWNSVFAPDRQF